jgi:hypothetical protein
MRVPPPVPGREGENEVIFLRNGHLEDSLLCRRLANQAGKAGPGGRRGEGGQEGGARRGGWAQMLYAVPMPCLAATWG